MISILRLVLASVGSLNDRILKKDEDDPVNHPSHYTDGKIDVIDFIEDKKLGFHLGNAVKYISRAGKKDPAKTIEDLEKARWYLDRYIQQQKALLNCCSHDEDHATQTT